MGLNEADSKAVAERAAVASPKRRRWWRRLLWLPVWFVAFTVLQVLVLRFVDPPFSMMMAERQARRSSVARTRSSCITTGAMPSRSPSNCRWALVAAEDQHFPTHSGFDFAAIEKARTNNAKGRKVRGGSTISQQLAKNLFLWRGRSWVRKGLEAWYTVLIEALWPKSRDHGGLRQRDRVRRRHLWRAGGLAPVLRQGCGAAGAGRGRAPGGGPANPRKYNAAKPGPYVQRRTRAIQRQMRALGGPAYVAFD